MGEVYRARDPRLDREIAIKVLAAELHQDETLRQRFEREARAIAQIQHPNVCTLYDVGSRRSIEFACGACLSHGGDELIRHARGRGSRGLPLPRAARDGGNDDQTARSAMTR